MGNTKDHTARLLEQLVRAEGVWSGVCITLKLKKKKKKGGKRSGFMISDCHPCFDQVDQAVVSSSVKSSHGPPT